MQRNLHFRCLTVALIGVLFGLGSAIRASVADSGQRTFGQASVEPAIDYSNGDTIYLLTPDKAPFPSKANPVAVAPLYLVVYPLSSTLPAAGFNCQPDNCDHVNVLPFPNANYGALPGNDARCASFNGGQACSVVKGHDHLVGVASTHGDFNVAWHVKLVVFTAKAFGDGTINHRVTTIGQLTTLQTNGELIELDTPITFNCSVTAERTYDLGTPVVIPFP
jgi:hypothetical protein